MVISLFLLRWICRKETILETAAEAKVKHMAKPKAQTKSPEPLREPTEREKGAISAAIARQAKRPARTKVSSKKTGNAMELGTPHSDKTGWHCTLFDTFGTSSFDFVNYAFAQTMEVVDQTGEKVDRYNAALALIGGIAPRDELEAAIACQMVATNALSMNCMSRAVSADTMDRREAFIQQATKLSRTFNSQVETLAKLRAGGKQQVEVRYVHVHGNAVIGDVQTGGGGAIPGFVGQPHAKGLSYAPGAPVPAMLREDPEGEALPVSGDERA
jgi:hypothetical protein